MREMTNKNVLISGASIAGPALAFWLRRYGFTPTVVERSPALREGGQAIDVLGTATEVVRRMGLLERVHELSTGKRGTSYVDAAGAVRASISSEVFNGVGAGGDTEIQRGDLARVLYEATRDDVEYLFGDSISELSEGEDGVRVVFEHGEPRTFDLVIGADGVHSRTRALAFGPESQFVKHMGYYIAIYTVPNFLGLDHWELDHNVPGKIAGCYSARENTEAKAIFAWASDPIEYDHRDSAQQKRLVAEAYAGVGWEAPRLLEHLGNAPDFYFDAMAQVRMDSWHRGRVALVGDAGYCASPLSGQGADLALVGAYLLAGELAAAGGDHAVAYAGYERRMRPMVDACQKFAEGVGPWYAPNSKAMIRFRDLNVRLLPYLPWRGLIGGAPQKVARTITLEDHAA
ncbi:2-polyprenyl-6-methoxyphenol hydroxylase-like FAD-dependent oxidoreductase [Nocardia transvalensis]|uniref:2-polyprenyl-6-methoxyphenol hydroxylase-like FAD-dependent oxidoreductase n=1 Tax=Nocardia transvalensis TaxID=37333 RepID=A0A7W9PK20_9NOCA|nr:FAD-dependent monooxygenase [Nocardia transvalensis]MBB5917589.1 2-polyprenyl-6-methoxyphenol hydroxylase-like FAD-dependent oxidoreductase [Nocardia transvalensis]